MIISFVLVLPLLPVTPIALRRSSFRYPLAKRCSADKVSGTSICGSPLRRRLTSLTKAPPASASQTAGKKAWPSNCSPRRATKNSPLRIARESVTTLGHRCGAHSVNFAVNPLCDMFQRSRIHASTTPPDVLPRRAQPLQRHQRELCDRRIPGTFRDPCLRLRRCPSVERAR